MTTEKFNLLDKVIASWRLAKIRPFIKKGDTILDFGCGHHGFLLRKFKDKVALGIGIDSHVESQEISANVKLIQHDPELDLPFKAETFDKIFLLAVFEHIPLNQTRQLLLSLKKILKKDGQIIMTIPTPKGKVILEFLAFQLKIISEVQITDHKKYYAKEDIEEEVNQAGMRLTYHEYFQFGWNSLQVIQKNN